MNNQGMLRNSIMSKTVFTAICGVGLIIIAPYLSSAFNINVATLSIVGMALIGFIVPELVMLFTNRIEDSNTKFVITKDILLITICFATLGFNMFGISSSAIAIVGMFSALFAAFTYMQHRTLANKIEMQQVEEATELKVVYIDAA